MVFLVNAVPGRENMKTTSVRRVSFQAAFYGQIAPREISWASYSAAQAGALIGGR